MTVSQMFTPNASARSISPSARATERLPRPVSVTIAVVSTRVLPRRLPPTVIEAPTSEITAPNPAMMAASNSAGGVMGKMISLTSLAVAVAATGMARSEEGKLFRFTIKHSVLLASLLGVLASIYAYLT